MSITPETRNAKFWLKIQQCDPGESCTACCWLWQGPVNTAGYGRLGWLIDGQQETYAHRIAWYLTYDSLPEPGLHIAHSCDTPACCNPAHLQEMTAAENHHDSQRKGRRAHNHTANVLSFALAEQIRQERMQHSQPSQRDLAARYGVSQVMIHRIVTCQAWTTEETHSMARPRRDKEAYITLTARVTTPMLEQIERYQLKIEEDHHGWDVERSAVIRNLLQKGLEAVGFPVPGPPPKESGPHQDQQVHHDIALSGGKGLTAEDLVLPTEDQQDMEGVPADLAAALEDLREDHRQGEDSDQDQSQDQERTAKDLAYHMGEES